ncbi:hypothetical protein [Sporosalibacterium faouarense]|uniref:hypothetical protein n=1 Tax=Sporosalibacterium faouarense TaxID=516123 RepID=UPI00192CD7F5|nr:hypothetical protein [Sporosalibacterium faouarense]
MKCNFNSDELGLTLPEGCCTGNTGCEFDGSMRNVRSEPIYVQKVYDAALFNLQGLRTVAGQPLSPALGRGARIIRVLDIRCRKFFNPNDLADDRNLTAFPETEISGGQFVKCNGKEVEVVGPDGTRSERLIYADTSECDDEGRGTPIFGTQNITITGNVVLEIDVLFTDDCDKKCEATLYANVPVAPPKDPLFLTNFFELCVPSVLNTAFLPRFTEFCNIACQPRLATNNIRRDLIVDSETGEVFANLIISLCTTCEKKIIVPVQLCVLSTGFPVLAADTSPVCSTFPPLFPDQIDEASINDPCPRPRPRSVSQAIEENEE